MDKATSNALNAQKSTGPATPEGRAISARNSIRHGLFSSSPTIKGERPRDWEAFLASLVESLSPNGGLEEVLVTRIALALWRHRRLISWELDAVERFSRQQDKRSDSFTYPHDMLPDPRVLDSVARYEAHISKQYRADLHELQRIQAARNGQMVMPPAAIDVNVDDVRSPECELKEEL